MKSIEVVAAVVTHNSNVLCVQRGPHKFPYISNKFEFPGGKVEPHETFEEAIEREIREELKLSVSAGLALTPVSHRYPDFSITLRAFMCDCVEPDKLELTEHVDFKWLPIDELDSLDWAEADIPIVRELQG